MPDDVRADPAAAMTAPSYDIFCRVVDNFGDIGVSWRLARQLSAPPHRRRVRLWVDDLRSFAKIEAAVDADLPAQTLQEVEIRHWAGDIRLPRPHDVVIEAFACDLPPAFVDEMARRRSLWINLEYLSAESWVEDCHARPSPQASGASKFFFFPGFTPSTGGLLREPGLLSARDLWLGDPSRRWGFLQRIGMPGALIENLRQGARQVFLFCYPHAPVRDLFDSLGRHARPSVVIVPAGVHPDIKNHDSAHVRVYEAPFVDQTDFDFLLWGSDLNFVRGEDSLVRAIWAGKPLVWHIYPQPRQAHLDKLRAWLARSGFGPLVDALMQSWNGSPDRGAADFAALADQALEPGHWDSWRRISADRSNELAARADLACALDAFCAKHRRTG